ncbi:hypothetical protein LAZ67_8000326 [Cordylochernes scorpioides]|uniref:HTH CENPB-type domain-containing protein n=1 Tax=Cordylochernes scorpioides TaxID=51811 RepID=A0ABY6KPW3_9ARAC|nr:hypothetical protein LAZ67_8000326 [Cordylochernes scorpioides]
MAGERKQTRNSLSLSVKLQILREIEVEKKKKTDVAQKHNIPQSSLSTIIKNSEKIHQQALHAGESSRKRARGSTYADVDEALLQWFKQARSAALPVNGPLLSEKAKTLALELSQLSTFRIQKRSTNCSDPRKLELLRFLLREDQIITYQQLEKVWALDRQQSTIINDHLKYRKLVTKLGFIILIQKQNGNILFGALQNPLLLRKFAEL